MVPKPGHRAIISFNLVVTVGCRRDYSYSSVRYNVKYDLLKHEFGLESRSSELVGCVPVISHRHVCQLTSSEQLIFLELDQAKGRLRCDPPPTSTCWVIMMVVVLCISEHGKCST